MSLPLDYGRSYLYSRIISCYIYELTNIFQIGLSLILQMSLIIGIDTLLLFCYYLLFFCGKQMYILTVIFFYDNIIYLI